MMNEGKIIIFCPNCERKLIIPKTTRKLSVTCPTCRNSFIYPRKIQQKKKASWFHNRVKYHPILFGLIVTIWFLILINRYLNRTLSFYNGFLTTIVCFVIWILGTWIIDKLKEERTKWYYKKWFVILMLFIFSPIGITLLWAGSKFSKSTKAVLTMVFGILFIYSIFTWTPEEFYYSPKEEIAKLIGSYGGDIYLRATSSHIKDSILVELENRGKSDATSTFTIPQIAKKWGKSVVLVRSLDKKGAELSQGSGFIISRFGAVVTNYHVVQFAYDVLIEFINKESYNKVTLIAGFPTQDIAILCIEEYRFSPVILGDSDDLEVGEQIIAIGNPYGWENSISDGLIGGIREIDGLHLLQISAPVSPGSSGGALFNMKGEIIGITTLGSQWGAQNLNFAIPINTALSLLKEELRD